MRGRVGQKCDSRESSRGMMSKVESPVLHEQLRRQWYQYRKWRACLGCFDVYYEVFFEF